MTSPQDTAPLAGERRPVSAVFADLVGSTSLAESLDPEDWAFVVNRLYAVASEAIARYDGTVTQLSGDAIVAVFGAPVAHEDDPERAVRAGLDLVAAVEELSERMQSEIGIALQVRVGVNTGLAVVGSVGGERHEEYTALGDAMNVAARMQTAARPGTVLITGATYGQVRELVDVVDVGALEVKGKSAPVAAFEVTRINERGGRPRGIPGLESPLVGRAQELDRLVELLDVVQAGRGRLALLLGEPGIGKSRLLAELRAHDGRIRWVEGRCLSYGRALPYHLVADLVASMAGSGGELTVDAVEQLAREQLGADAATTAHLCHLLGLPVEPEVAAELAALDPPAVRRRHVDALAAVLERMARAAPLALVCEDLHWSDAASVDVLIELCRVVDRCPILFLGTARPERETEGWRFITEARTEHGDALTELRLEALPREDSRALIAHLLEIESLPVDVRHVILERTDGNPFFIEEVIRALIDDGLIARRGQRWVAQGHLSRLDVPGTVQGLLLARIDRLPEDARRALGVASVLGRTFTAPLLETVTEGGVDVAAELGTLEAHGLVEIAATRPQLSYTFRHALVQEAAYGGLLRRERQALHRRVADVLEAEHAGRTEEVAAHLAHHLDLAREPERAVPYLLEAGRQAFARYAHGEAHGLFTRAGDLLADRMDATASRQRVEARVGQAEASATFVPAAHNLAVLEAVLPEAEALGDERLLARVHVDIAGLHRYLGELTSPRLRASMERAFELSERLDDDTLLALPLEVRADLAYGAGRYRDAVTNATRAVAIRERREQLADAAVYAGLAAVSHARLGEFDEADALIARGQELAERSGAPSALGDIDLFHGLVETERGNLEVAVEHTRRGLERAQELGNTDCQLIGSFNLGDLHLRMGDVDAAIPMLEQSSEMAAYCNAGPFSALSGAWLAAARSRTGGDLDAELRGFAEALERARCSGLLSGEAEIRRHRAAAVAAQPDADWDAVVGDFEVAIGILEELEARPALARTLHDYGMALDLAGRSEDAKAMLERAAELVETMGITVRP